MHEWNGIRVFVILFVDGLPPHKTQIGSYPTPILREMGEMLRPGLPEL